MRGLFSRWQDNASALGYVVVTGVLMVALYALLYREYPAGSVPAKAMGWYLELTAQGSAGVLSSMGEAVQRHGATVTGRFSYVVVLDCAALDAQALITAAVLAFPSPWWTRLAGIGMGLAFIYVINVLRLVGLYFAGAHSRELFNVLHEEVLVFVIIALVCGVFMLWARWARRRGAGLRIGDAAAEAHAS